MGGMAAFLDGGRKQNIAMLTMEFAGREESGDIGREDNGSTPKPIQSSEKVTSCSWEYPKRAQKKPHVFAEYLTTRGFAEQENTEPELDDDDNHKPLRTRLVLPCQGSTTLAF